MIVSAGDIDGVSIPTTSSVGNMASISTYAGSTATLIFKIEDEFTIVKQAVADQQGYPTGTGEQVLLSSIGGTLSQYTRTVNYPDPDGPIDETFKPVP